MTLDQEILNLLEDLYLGCLFDENNLFDYKCPVCYEDSYPATGVVIHKDDCKLAKCLARLKKDMSESKKKIKKKAPELTVKKIKVPKLTAEQAKEIHDYAMEVSRKIRDGEPF